MNNIYIWTKPKANLVKFNVVRTDVERNNNQCNSAKM